MRQDLVWILGSKARSQLTRRRVVGTSLALTAAGLVASVMALGGLPALEGLPARLSLGRDHARAQVATKKPESVLAGPTTAVSSLTPAAAPSTVPQTSGDDEPDVIPALGPVVAAPTAPNAGVAPAASSGTATTPSRDPAKPPVNGTVAALPVNGPSAAAGKVPGIAPIIEPLPTAAATPHQPAAPVATAASSREVSGPTPAARAATPAVASGTPAPADSRASTPAPSVSPPRSNVSVAASAAPPRSAAPEKALLAAESLRGRRNLEALEAYRLLGSRYPRDPKVLEGWSRVAATTQWWGESLKIAERWAAVDRSAPAQIHLARIQRRMGQTAKAIGTLKALLERSPKDADAQELLTIYAGSQLALR